MRWRPTSGTPLRRCGLPLTGGAQGSTGDSKKMDSDNAVAAIAVIVIFGLPCAVWLVSRVLAHQERMEMLRRGFTPPPDSREMRRAMRMGWTPGTAGKSIGQSVRLRKPFLRATATAQRHQRRVHRVRTAHRTQLHRVSRRARRVRPVVARRFDPALRRHRADYQRGARRCVARIARATRRVSVRLPIKRFRRPDTANTRVPPPGPTYGGWRPGATAGDREAGVSARLSQLKIVTAEITMPPVGCRRH